MKFGLHGVNLHGCAQPDTAARFARAAEAAGFDSLWVADHVVLPDPPVPGRPMAPDMPLLDPIVSLTFLAAHTERVLLGTGVIILPQRQALVSPSSSPRSTCCPRAGSSSAWAWAGASRRCARSAPRSPTAAASPTSISPRCARCGRRPARLQGAPRGVRGRAGDAASRADAGAGRRRRPHRPGVPPRRDPGPRLVRLRPRRRHHRNLRRRPRRGRQALPSPGRARTAGSASRRRRPACPIRPRSTPTPWPASTA